MSKTIERTTIGLLLAASLMLVPAASRAEDSALQAAREFYKQGSAQYDLKNYERALEKYAAALKLVKRPNLYLAIAQCYRQLNQPEKAILNYRLYLATWRDQEFLPRSYDGPQKAPHEEEVLGYIRQLSAKQPQERRHPEGPTGPILPKWASGDPWDRDGTQHAAQPRPPTAAPVPFYKTWWFWTAVGVVVVGGVTAAAVAGARPEADKGVVGTLPPGQVQF